MARRGRQVRWIGMIAMVGLICAWRPVSAADPSVTAIAVDFGTRYRTAANPHPWRVTAMSTVLGDVTADCAPTVRVGFEGEAAWDSDHVMLSHSPRGKRGEVTISVPCGVTGLVFGGMRDNSSFPSDGMEVRARFAGTHGAGSGGEAWFWQDHGLAAGVAAHVYQLSGKAGALQQHATLDTALRLYKAKPRQYGPVIGNLVHGNYRDYDNLLFGIDAARTLITLSAYGSDDFSFDKVILLCLIGGPAAPASKTGVPTRDGSTKPSAPARPTPDAQAQAMELFNQGLEAYDEGRFDEAARKFDGVSALSIPDHMKAQAIYHEALSYQARSAKQNDAGARAVAEGLYRGLTRRFPDDEYAKRAMERLEAMAGGTAPPQRVEPSRPSVVPPRPEPEAATSEVTEAERVIRQFWEEMNAGNLDAAATHFSERFRGLGSHKSPDREYWIISDGREAFRRDVLTLWRSYFEGWLSCSLDGFQVADMSGLVRARYAVRTMYKARDGAVKEGGYEAETWFIRESGKYLFYSPTLAEAGLSQAEIDSIRASVVDALRSYGSRSAPVERVEDVTLHNDEILGGAPCFERRLYAVVEATFVFVDTAKGTSDHRRWIIYPSLTPDTVSGGWKVERLRVKLVGPELRRW